MTARVGIDIGGTFTDFALETDGGIQTLKVLTTPRSPEIAALDGLDRVLAAANVEPADLSMVIHGTTLAINTLIERRGARVAFLTTEGFRDTLEMGYESRYDHYALDVDKPAPIVARDMRFTLRERMAASGDVLVPLDETALDPLLPLLDARQVEAVAVGFLHSYRNPLHEQRVADRLRRARPRWHISTSADVAPEIREYERFATVCANAYVQPLMAGYLRRMEEGLRDRGIAAPLFLMLSNGGLCDVETACRYPVRLLDSGPAGGAILAAEIARRQDIDRALLVDIGGTTAKLCFIDGGRPDHARGMEVARLARFKSGSGIPLRMPVIELAEIGAGGGSIASIDALGRLRVGPESAGADPGPACYARGGRRATVTDAHVLLGRLPEETFAGGGLTLDRDAAAEAIGDIGRTLSLSETDAAWSMCEVMDENMAAAAREHALEVGKDLPGRTLIAIGGMAPMHAARLAVKLGLARVIIPAAAGVGSAVGFLRAPIAFESTRSEFQILARFDAAATNAALQDITSGIAAVVQQAKTVQADGNFAARVAEQRFALMRYQGQGHEIPVELPARPFTDGDRGLLEAAFAKAYRERYGRVIEDAPVELLGWTVRLEVPMSMDRPLKTSSGVGDLPQRRRSFLDQELREFVEGDLAGIDSVPVGGTQPGPALLALGGSTAVIPSGFRAQVGAAGELVLERAAPGAPIAGIPAEIRSQLLWARIAGVVEEQARTLMRTAFSPTVREAGDLAAGVFDEHGRLIAQAVTGTPGHVNSMARCAGHFLARYPAATLRDGDHFITNDPWLTSGHLHDMTVFSPVFRSGRPIGFFACTCHQVDIGGLGQGPDGKSVHEEGLYIPIMPLARAGRINDDLLDILRANVREPKQVVGDVLSYVTANEVSARSLCAALDDYREPDLRAIAETVIARSRAGMREAISRLPRGTFHNQMSLDGYDEPVSIHCALTTDGERILIDFAGTSPASSHGINLVLNYTRAYAAFGVRAAIAPEVPNNAGSLSLVDVIAPEGSILNAVHPAPVSARHIIGQFLPEVALGCLAQVLPGRIPAEGAACNWGLQLRGGPAVARLAGRADLATGPFEILFFNTGGMGARSGSDGLSATAFPSGIRSIPVEICEAAAPIVIWTKELLPDSGGVGRQRGGLGQRVEVATVNGAPFQVFAIFDRVQHPARGRNGGADGRPGWVGLRSGQPLRSKGLQLVPAGEVLRIDVPGGAGLGPPSERSRSAIAEDVRLGYVSAEAAIREYGSS